MKCLCISKKRIESAAWPVELYTMRVDAGIVFEKIGRYIVPKGQKRAGDHYERNSLPLYQKDG